MKIRMLPVLFGSSCLMALGFGAAVTATGAMAADVPVVADGISGVVTSAKGPEAGVWVIAQTMDVAKDKSGPVRYIKEVVTDDEGRYVVPDLPKGKYKVWVRGYGLVDSEPVENVAPGKKIDLKAVVAPDAKAAAQYYPANYWFALIHPPAADEFPGTGADGNGIAPTMKTQMEWLTNMKDSCGNCHQFGDKATRELANSTPDGWATRIKMARPEGDQAVGNQAAGASQAMQNTMARYGLKRALGMYADWTTRIAGGEIPKEAPPRPTGVERNVVLTVQDWGNGRFVHDTVSTNRDNPTVNANGPIYGGANFAGRVEIFNPKTHMAQETGYGFKTGGVTQEPDIDTQPHSADMDALGRVWISDPGSHFSDKMGPGLMALKRPDYCAEGSDNKFAKYFPPDPAKRQRIGTAVIWDPKTKQFTGITTCFGIHHDHFGKDDVVYYGGDNGVFGWIDTKVWDATHDAQKAMGWCPMVLNTKEKGATKVAFGSDNKDDLITPDRTQWNQPGQPRDPKKDTRINGFGYGMDINPVDGSVWFTDTAPSAPSAILRFERGSNPPETCKTEYYEPPKNPDGTYVAFNGRGMSVDTKGIAWVAFGSGKFGSFDRSKCKVLNGPTATGQQCPEGWKFYDMPSPKIAGTNVASDWYYTDFVDRHDTLGLGKDVPIATASQSDSLIAVMPDTGKTVTMRVPYPMGFYSRIMDGRIDDPKAGWKGKGIWASYSMVPVWHQEGGVDGEGPQLVHFQVRPDPLAH